MTALAPHPCAGAPRCGALVERGERWCARCRTRAYRADSERRGSSRERGYTTAWDRYSVAYRREHPLCATHLAAGHVVDSRVVDHITPHKGDPALFADPRNHQPLCLVCHNRKSALEGGFGMRTAHSTTEVDRGGISFLTGCAPGPAPQQKESKGGYEEGTSSRPGGMVRGVCVGGAGCVHVGSLPRVEGNHGR